MIFWIVENGKLVEYERLGECNRCGKCCNTKCISFTLGAYSEGPSDKAEDYDWSDYEGYSIFRAQGLTWYMTVTTKEEAGICSDLDDNVCTLWMQDDFPVVCRYWPVHPDNLEHFPNCRFSFERREYSNESET
jgi:Fe-S-cluster containining protein